MNLFGNIFNNTLTLGNFTLAICAAAIFGLIVALGFMFKNKYSKNFASALILVPLIETVVIILVNDNLGMGLSVAGSFALIRFRSVKGNAKELAAVFAAMTIGVVCGSGYIALAGVFAILVTVLFLVLSLTNFGQMNDKTRYLKITVPESLNYDDAFNAVLDKYCFSYELCNLKTLNLGSLFRVEYDVNLKDVSKMKNMIDELRTKNGNLEIYCGRPEINREEL